MTEAPLSELYVTVAEWAGTRGAENLAERPGLWSDTCGEFVITVNPHDESAEDQFGLSLGPFDCSIHAPDYLGAIMLLNPYGGIAPPGMEDDVIAALKADIAKAGTPQP